MATESSIAYGQGDGKKPLEAVVCTQRYSTQSEKKGTRHRGPYMVGPEPGRAVREAGLEAQSCAQEGVTMKLVPCPSCLVKQERCKKRKEGET